MDSPAEVTLYEDDLLYNYQENYKEETNKQILRDNTSLGPISVCDSRYTGQRKKVPDFPLFQPPRSPRYVCNLLA